MKKFKFSLEKVLEYKEHVENIEKDTLAVMRLEHDKICEHRRRMSEEYERSKLLFLSRCREGTDANDIAARRRYLDMLQRQIKQLDKAIDESAQRIDMQLERLLSVSKEKASLQKLKEKYIFAYGVQQRKEDEIFISEFIANTAASY